MKKPLTKTELKIIEVTTRTVRPMYCIVNAVDARTAHRMVQEGVIKLVRAPRNWAHRDIHAVHPDWVALGEYATWDHVTAEFLASEWELEQAEA